MPMKKKDSRMRFHCVVNPYGGGCALKAWREVQSILRAKGIEHSVHFPTRTYVVHDIVRDLSDVSDDAENVYIIIGGGVMERLMLL